MKWRHVKREFELWWYALEVGPRHWYEWPIHVVATTMRELAYTITHVLFYVGIGYGLWRLA